MPTLSTKPHKANRWRAVIHYRSQHGTCDVEHQFEELCELHDLVERGPHWDCIERIEVFRINHTDSRLLTVEQARDL